MGMDKDKWKSWHDGSWETDQMRDMARKGVGKGKGQLSGFSKQDGMREQQDENQWVRMMRFVNSTWHYNYSNKACRSFV